jgi:ribonuclease VapC
MVIDTSAIVAILLAEPEAAAFERLIGAAPVARISAATLVELGVVVDTFRDPIIVSLLERMLDDTPIVVEPLTETQARIASDAHQRFGRSSGHPARLNMGDCFSYALARDLDEPLLFKGNDFAQTDIELVVDQGGGRRLSEVVASYGAA